MIGKRIAFVERWQTTIEKLDTPESPFYNSTIHGITLKVDVRQLTRKTYV